jgi:hypothetical protein
MHRHGKGIVEYQSLPFEQLSCHGIDASDERGMNEPRSTTAWWTLVAHGRRVARRAVPEALTLAATEQ